MKNPMESAIAQYEQTVTELGRRLWNLAAQNADLENKVADLEAKLKGKDGDAN